jgi:hypothetical protein
LRITYQVTEKDFVDGQRLFRATVLPLYRRLGRQGMMLFGAFLFASSLFLLANRHGRKELPTMIVSGISGALLTGLYAFYPDYAAKRKFHTDGRIRREMTVEFSNEGLAAKSGEMESYSAWQKFAGYAESSRVFLLFLSPRLFLLFPKRVFPVAEVAEFRQILQNHVPAMKASRNRGAIPA